MAASWVAVARSGDPNHTGIAKWPPYTPDRRQTMIFNTASRVENDRWIELRAIWSES
jgi:para-nitrobenzyl esterase